MKKAVIYCFSGTGNTKRVCETLKNELINFDIYTDIFDVTYTAYKCREFPNPNDYDLIGLAYPGHAFNAPLLFNKFVRRLPNAERKQQAFIIKTSGEPFKVNNGSSNAVKRYLKRKGFDLTYERHYLMPYNIMFRYPDGLAKQMYLYTFAMAKVSAEKIDRMERERLKNCFGSLIMCFLGKIEWFGAWFNGRLFKVNKKKCIKCGLCVKNCPAGNIKIDKKGRFKFGSKCILCCRCTMNCPKDAVNMGLLTKLKVNGGYPFEKLAENPEVSGNYVNEKTKGYYKKFLNYYEKTDEELARYGIQSPRAGFEPDNYAVMSKRQKKKYKKEENRNSQTA